MQGAAALFCAPAIIKIENLMPVSKIILPGDIEYDRAMLGENVMDFSIHGLSSGDRVMVKDVNTGEILINQRVTDRPISARLLKGKGRDIKGLIKRHGMVPQVARMHLTGDLQWRIGRFQTAKEVIQSGLGPKEIYFREPKELIYG